jgi:hypothetical protein
VPRLGPKAFDTGRRLLAYRDAPTRSTPPPAPESYAIVEKMAADLA